MEAIFDACYLIFDLIAGILFFVYSKGNPLFILYGVLTLTLCGGDAFHLVPRIKRALYGTNDKIKKTAWNWIAGIFNHYDRILYNFIVYLETNIPNITSSTLGGGYDLDFSYYSYRRMFLTTK